MSALTQGQRDSLRQLADDIWHDGRIVVRADGFTFGELRALLADSDALAACERERYEAKHNAEMSWGCLMEIREVLEVAPCPCGSDHAHTPPMFYREWLISILAGLRAQVATLREALGPFAHEDLRALMSGNISGDSSPVYGRNNATLTIGDFKRAAAALLATAPAATRTDATAAVPVEQDREGEGA